MACIHTIQLVNFGMRISDWMQDVNANTIYMKDSFDSEGRSADSLTSILIALEDVGIT